ncbi:hypothetical protein [Streptomyces sp. NPDC087300]|uniref:hypothetical protein n=1 Tax=Streptomyces sp. NPDC087300 TaxID=3365780 RepID=UPI003817FABF
MSKPNTRQFDKLIRDGQRKLREAERREMSGLNGAERGAVLRAAAVGAAKVARGGSGAREKQAADEAWAGAAARISAEITAAQTAKAAAVAQAAADKVAKKTKKGGWF